MRWKYQLTLGLAVQSVGGRPLWMQAGNPVGDQCLALGGRTARWTEAGIQQALP